MKTKAAFEGVVVVVTLAAGIHAARADEPEAVFRVKNTTDVTAGVWVGSEKGTEANPWTHVDIDAGKDATIALKAPDRFVVVVDYGTQRSRSKPIALRAFLAKHPNYLLSLDLIAFRGAGDGFDGGRTFSIDFLASDDPAKQSQPAKSSEVPRFEFSSELKQP
ncbi:MAG TPA: hypothetical protein VGY55_03450 [Pirellulales bacterium]|jgi:hypothetical protein|nr:hypothetical protein [Pirellulales bacterium]